MAAMASAAMMDSDTDEARTLRMTRVLPAPPARVYRAWTEKEQFGRWFGPKDVECSECELDAREGGGYRLVMVHAGGQTHIVSGVFEELQPDFKLAFTWGWQQPDGSRSYETRVEITLLPHEDGTEIHLFQQLFEDTPTRDKHQSGWNGCLDSLADFLAA